MQARSLHKRRLFVISLINQRLFNCFFQYEVTKGLCVDIIYRTKHAERHIESDTVCNGRPCGQHEQV